MFESLKNDRPLSTADIANRKNDRPTEEQQRASAERAGMPPPSGGQVVRPPDPAAQPDLADGPRPVPAEQIDNNRPQPTGDAARPVDTAEQNRAAAAAAQPGTDDRPGPLFPQQELENFRSQWDKTQSMFVDDPRMAVKQADGLVANTVQRIAEQFAHERERLEQQWDREGNVSTEDLRLALRRYRDFFQRLLSL